MSTLNSNAMNSAQSIIDNLGTANIKRVKKEDGLLEREKMNDDKVILVEDNRQILLG